MPRQLRHTANQLTVLCEQWRLIDTQHLHKLQSP